MTDLANLKKQNSVRWTAMKLTPNRVNELTNIAKDLCDPAAKLRYTQVSLETGVPWFVIAVIHERESGQNWLKSIAQGDRWDKKSVHVPIGRGPFHSWEESAKDALVHCSPYAARNKDWSIGGTLTILEQYNGLKYATANRPSPYIWSGSDQYVTGKVLYDHGPIVDVVDHQDGCAPLIYCMMKLDSTVQFDEKVKTQEIPKIQPKESFWESFINFFRKK